MRKKILLLVLGLMSSCTQPSVTVVAPQATAPIVKQSAVVPQTSSNPQAQASVAVTPHTQVVVQPDNTLNKPPYAVNHPVAENIRSGDVSITFKDEFKVRFSKDPNATGFKLTSISSQDKLKEVENILGKYNANNIRDLGYSEERANEIEITNEKECQCDDSNFLSSYYFTIENQNMKEMIEKLRSISIVREVNYAAPTSSGFN